MKFHKQLYRHGVSNGLAKRRGRRWSDRDRHWGPFTYSSPDYPNIGFSVCSGSSGQRPYALLRMGTRTLLCELPVGWVKPWRHIITFQKPVEFAAGELGNACCKPTRYETCSYEDSHKCEYGFNVHKSGTVGGRYDYLSISLGPQTGDSHTTRDWSCFLPWMTYRHVRDTMLATDGSVWWNQFSEPEPLKWPWTNVRTSVAWDRWRKRRQVVRDQEQELEKHAPTVTYRFRDFDGQELTAKCRIYESEWRRGENLFRWLGVLYKPEVIRRLDVVFSGETGNRKGSWKGGTLSSTGPTKHGHNVEAAFRAYCDEHRMTFLGPVQDAPLAA
jgi:hypothetical protein